MECRVESLMRNEVLLDYEVGFAFPKRPYREELEGRILSLIDQQDDQVKQLEEDMRKTKETFMCLADSLIATLKVKIEAQQAHSIKIENITRFPTHKQKQAIVGRQSNLLLSCILGNFSSKTKSECFGKRGKLNPCYIRPFKIISKVGTVAYRLELPKQLSRVHSTFHVFNLKKCLSDETLAILLDEIQIDYKLHFIEEPIKIIDRKVKCLKQSCIPIVKVHWNSRRGPEFTWEHEDQMQKKYPHLFANLEPSSNITS
ncbi:hypothetical protein Tco_1361727 [Tanacetum coccineum]